MYLTYRDYITREDEIASVFWKDAGTKRKPLSVTSERRKADVVLLMLTQELISQIALSRELLAKNVALEKLKALMLVT